MVVRVCVWCMYACYSYYEEDPEDELQVVHCIEPDNDDESNEVVFLFDVENGLESVPETDGYQGDHGC